MHSCLLLCIELHKCDRNRDINVIVIFMWYVTCVLSTWIIYMSCHLVMLICFASTFYSDANELYYLYSCLFHMYRVHHVGLGHTSMPNSFVLIVICLYEPSMLKTSLISIIYSRLCCHQSPKRGRLKASRPLVGFWWLMTWGVLYICHVTWLCSFVVLPHFTPFQMSFTSCTHA